MLRRPWDGSNGADFKAWLRAQEDLVAGLLKSESEEELTDSSSDSEKEEEPPIDETNVLAIERRKQWEAKQAQLAKLNKYKWPRPPKNEKSFLERAEEEAEARRKAEKKAAMLRKRKKKAGLADEEEDGSEGESASANEGDGSEDNSGEGGSA